ncbi:unnamed protein product [Cuscuta campestris]|uniref:Uncharacterized protein n=1 Tax=Cuscuta campestris TaxID=132261 RepID=A0A484KU54_9ASTE|nr:unnamed protein product [Cuscuta campestris]
MIHSHNKEVLEVKKERKKAFLTAPTATPLPPPGFKNFQWVCDLVQLGVLCVMLHSSFCSWIKKLLACMG